MKDKDKNKDKYKDRYKDKDKYKYKVKDKSKDILLVSRDVTWPANCDVCIQRRSQL